MSIVIDAVKAANYLKDFMPAVELKTMKDNLAGEESQFFIDKLVEMADLIKAMPKTYDQDNTKDPLVTLHYFIGGCDWYIIEKDMEDEQHQAFGYADLGMGCPELGYISIIELLENNVELDLHFTPKKLSEVKKERGDN